MQGRWTPLPPCRKRGCPNLQARDGRGYCEEHREEADRESRRGRFRVGGGSTRRYRKARAQVLREQPLCVRCLERGRVREAEETHHIIPRSEGGPDTADNLLPLCRECHQREHAARRREPEFFSRAAGRTTAGGVPEEISQVFKF